MSWQPDDRYFTVKSADYFTVRAKYLFLCKVKGKTNTTRSHILHSKLKGKEACFKLRKQKAKWADVQVTVLLEDHRQTDINQRIITRGK